MKKCIGQLWSKNEEEKLVQSLIDNKTINEISVEHRRTNNAITKKIKQLAIKMSKDGKNKNEIKNSLKFVSDIVIDNIINKKENEIKKKNKKYENDINDIKNCLFEIKNMLSLLVDNELKKKEINLFEINKNPSDFIDDYDKLSIDSSFETKLEHKYQIKSNTKEIFLAATIAKSLIKQFGKPTGYFYKSGESKLGLVNLPDNIPFRLALCEILRNNNYNIDKAIEVAKEKFISGELYEIVNNISKKNDN